MKKKIIIVLGIILSICLAIMIFLQISKKDAEQILLKLQNYRTAPDYVKDYLIDPATDLNISTSFGDSGYQVPINGDDNGVSLYCVSRGTAPKIEGMTKEELESTVNNWLAKECIDHIEGTSTIVTEEQVQAYIDDLAALGGESVDSLKSILSTKAYYTLESQEVVEGSAAYLFNQAGGEFSGYVQEAIWNNAVDGIVNEGNPAQSVEDYETAGDSRAEYAKGYQEKVNEANSYNDFYNSLNKDADGNPAVSISYGGTTKVDRNSQSYSVGPLSIDYPSTGGFGQITDISYDIGGGNVSHSFSEYPASGSEFNLSFSGAGDAFKSDYITITVTYEWDEYYAQVFHYKGESYSQELYVGKYGPHQHTWDEIIYVSKHKSDVDCDSPGTCTDNSHYEDVPETDPQSETCMIKADTSCYPKVTNEEQPLIGVYPFVIHRVAQYQIKIPVTDEEGYNPTIDIGGNVWEDLKAGKENVVNGKFDETELPVEGITVILHEANGNIAQDKYDKQTITTTDAEGNYLFEKLNPMLQYYVEFQYNGQHYENTIYEDNLSGGYSNATESTNDRDEFNLRFEELDGIDDGYDKAYLENQDTYIPINDKFKISAYTGADGLNQKRLYPSTEKFTITVVENEDYHPTDEDGNPIETDKTYIGDTKYDRIYGEEDNSEDLLNIDFGITERIEFDMALKKDLYIATVKINGKTQVYGYDEKNIGNNDGETGDTWTINVVGGYERGLDKSDYNFNGENGNNQVLEVYATYKIAVRNQSQSMLGHVTKLYDYYDETFEYIEDLSWKSGTNYTKSKSTLDDLQNKFATGKIEDGERVNAKVSNDSSTSSSNGSENKLEIDVGKKQASGETVYLYLTFKLNSNSEGKLELGEKENAVEIGAFKTYYKEGTILPHYGVNNCKIGNDTVIAGRIDKDSIPSNYSKEQGPQEDDEDEAPILNVKLTDDVRKINGNVWEDERTNKVNEAIVGNGTREDSEKGIEGITVELVEKTVGGEYYTWQTKETDANGNYNFSGYIPGDYIVRFIYGNNITETNASKTSYNGQDFKSTTYQAGVETKGIGESGFTDLDNKYKPYTDTENQNETATYGYDIAASEGKNVSDAKDIWTSREKVINYSKEGVTNNKAEILASPYYITEYNEPYTYTQDEINELYKKFKDNTYMIAETGVIVAEVEKNTQSTEGNGAPSYTLEGIDFGLEERPKAQLEIDKKVTNVKVTLANGTILVDVKDKANNVMWIKHQEYNIESRKDGNGLYEKHNSYRDEIDKIVKNNDHGLIQITMDEELMHGATIEATYEVKVKNAGEYDYNNKGFYYLGKSGNEETVVTTSADMIVDYVANNFKFSTSGNDGWELIEKNQLINEASPQDTLVNAKLKESVDKYNYIIKTEALKQDLKPGEATSPKELVLTQLITGDNSEDDLTYRNIVEIVKISNTVGRRMAFSIVGNQDPTREPTEVDSARAERIIILTPFGKVKFYYGLAIVIGLTLVIGIALIIKKVMIKKERE